MTVARHLCGYIVAGIQRLELAVHRLGPLPVLRLNHTQSVTQPFVQVSPDSRCLHKSEVRLPALHIGPELFQYLLQTASARAASELPNWGNEVLQWLLSHLAFDFFALS